MQVFRWAAGYFWLTVGIAVLIVPLLFFGLMGATTKADAVIKLWCRVFVAIVGARIKVIGLENIQPNSTYVLMCNHRSHVDGPVLIVSLPLRFGFLVKKELTRIPIFGWGMVAADYISVDRQNPQAARASVDVAAERVRKGRSILVFPEGTRSPTEEFLPFKKGGIVIAIKAQVPILPISISGSGKIIPKHTLRSSPGQVLVAVHKPINTQGLTLEHREELLNKVKEAIVAGYIPHYPQSAQKN